MGQVKARLIPGEGVNGNNITYAEAVPVVDGRVVHGRIGWAGCAYVGHGDYLVDPADPTGRYRALWHLAQTLSRAGVEVE